MRSVFVRWGSDVTNGPRPFALDLVVAGIYTTRTTVALLKRFGLPVLDLDVPQSLPAIAAQIRTVAHVLGHPERGEAMVTAMMADLTALGPVLVPWSRHPGT